jgi:hypothetical protein
LIGVKKSRARTRPAFEKPQLRFWRHEDFQPPRSSHIPQGEHAAHKSCLSICGAIDLQAVAAGLSVEVLLCKAVKGFLYRETAIRVVHVVVDDQVMKLLRLAQWRRQRQQQHTLHSPSSSGGALPFTQGSPVFISVNEIEHDLFGAVSVGGNGAPTRPSMQGRLDGGETPLGPTKMLVA